MQQPSAEVNQVPSYFPESLGAIGAIGLTAALVACSSVPSQPSMQPSCNGIEVQGSDEAKHEVILSQNVANVPAGSTYVFSLGKTGTAVESDDESEPYEDFDNLTSGSYEAQAGFWSSNVYRSCKVVRFIFNLGGNPAIADVEELDQTSGQIALPPPHAPKAPPAHKPILSKNIPKKKAPTVAKASANPGTTTMSTSAKPSTSAPQPSGSSSRRTTAATTTTTRTR